MWPRSVMVLREDQQLGGDIDDCLTAGLEAQGCAFSSVRRGDAWPDEPHDLVLAYGPFGESHGSIPAVARQALTSAWPAQPALVWWLTEGVPNPTWPLWLTRALASLRLAADSWLGPAEAVPAWQRPLRRGHRARILGQLRAVRAGGGLTVLAVTSQMRADYLRQHGLCPVVVPLGLHAGYGRPMHLTRDIDVLFLGNTSSPRRRKLLPPLVRELEGRGHRVVLQNAAYGEERQRLLNRSRVLVNILRAPQDFVGQRFLLGAANQTLVVSETMADTAPFVPGKHLVTAPLPCLADAISHYLADEVERCTIVDQAYAFVQTSLTAESVVGRLLDAARAARCHRSAGGHERSDERQPGHMERS